MMAAGEGVGWSHCTYTQESDRIETEMKLQSPNFLYQSSTSEESHNIPKQNYHWDQVVKVGDCEKYFIFIK